MPLVSQRIESLLNGVSEQPPERRHSSEAEEQINFLSSPSHGLIRRPPAIHVAKLSGPAENYAGAHIHPVSRDESERYWVAIRSGGLEVFNRDTGESHEVLFSGSATSYLTGASEGFRALTLGDTTVIVNRSKAVGTLATAAPEEQKEALVFVRQADFSTGYTITLEGEAVSHVTVDGTSAAARHKIATDYIASELYSALLANTRLNAAFNFLLIGSTIHIERKDGKDFQVSTKDGLADKGIRVVKGAVQSIEDLPYRAVDGFVVKVTGHPGSGVDDYYVAYDASETAGEAGVWRETLKPGVRTSLDPATLPHMLVRGGSLTPELTAVDAPLLPAILDGTFVDQDDGWTVNPSEGVVSAETDDLLRDHLSARRHLLSVSDDTLPRKLFVNYDVDTGVMEAGTQASAVLRRKAAGSGSFVEISRKTYGAGRTWDGEYMKVEGTFNDGDELELAVEYGEGVSPAASRRALFLGRRKGHPQFPGIRQRLLTTRRIDFNGTLRYPFRFLRGRGVYSLLEEKRRYPAGMTVSVLLNSTHTVTYTVGATDETDAQVAQGVAMAVNAHVAYTASLASVGVVEVGVPSGAAPTIAVSYDFAPEEDAWVPGAALTPGALIGSFLVNLTDGSSGIIVANSGSVIQTSGMTGGALNRVSTGDTLVVRKAGTYFVVSPCPWRSREVGDLEKNPWPSFVDEKIREVFFIQGRLGFTHGESVCLSSTGDIFSFFRETITDLLPSDPVDITSAHALSSKFHTAETFANEMYLWSEAGQFILSGDPISPQTVRLDLVSRFPNRGAVRPCHMGSRMLFVRHQGGRTQVMEYMHPPQEAPSADELTVRVPTYIQGTPKVLTGDPVRGTAFLKCTAGNTLYVFSTAFREDGIRGMSSWSRWELSGDNEIIHCAVQDGQLGILSSRLDGVHLLTLPLDVVETEPEIPPHPRTITVSPNPFTIEANESVQLTTVVLDENGNEMESVPLVFESLTPSIVSVSSSGLVTSSTLVGTATVRVTAPSGFWGDSAITVEAIITVVSVSPAEVYFPSVSGSQQMTAEARTATGIIIPAAMSWGVTAGSVVSAGSTGIVTPAGPGVTRVRATSPNGVHGYGAACVVDRRTTWAAEGLGTTPSGFTLASTGGSVGTAAVVADGSMESGKVLRISQGTPAATQRVLASTAPAAVSQRGLALIRMNASGSSYGGIALRCASGNGVFAALRPSGRIYIGTLSGWNAVPLSDYFTTGNPLAWFWLEMYYPASGNLQVRSWEYGTTRPVGWNGTYPIGPGSYPSLLEGCPGLVLYTPDASGARMDCAVFGWAYGDREVPLTLQ